MPTGGASLSFGRRAQAQRTSASAMRSTPGYELLQEGRQAAGAEVVAARPGWRDRDPGHLWVDAAHLCFERLEFRGAHGLGRSGKVLGWHAIDDLDFGDTADQECLLRCLVGVDRQRHVGALAERLNLRRGHSGTEEEPLAIPVEPDRDHPRESVAAGVSKPGRAGMVK